MQKNVSNLSKMRHFIFSLLIVFSSIQLLAATEKPNSNNYFERLGISESASQEEIKTAYRRLMMKYHPDRNPNISREVMQNIKEAYEILSNKKTVITKKNNGFSGRGDKSDFNFPPKEIIIKELFDFYNNKNSNKGDELKILLQVFLMEKYDLEGLVRDSNFSKISDKIFSSPLWRDTQNKLLDIFVRGWGLYSTKTSTDSLVKLFSQLNPNDPYLKNIIYDYNFTSIGSEFQNRTGRKNWLLVMKVKMLSQEQYLGTVAGEKLLEHIYAMWQQFKAGEKLSPYPRDLWAIEILKLLEIPVFKDHPKVIDMVRDIPQLLHESYLGFGGVFSFQNDKNLYRATIKKHPNVFQDANINSPIDDLIWFYNDLSAKERNAKKDIELKILERVLKLNRSQMEALQKDEEFNNVMKKSFARSIWQDSSNGLFDLFINRWGFASMKHSNKLVGAMFGKLDPEDRALMRVIYDVDFGLSPGNDFRTKEERLKYLRPILSQMLLENNYLNTEAGQKLMHYIVQLWQDIIRKSGSFAYMEQQWVYNLLETMSNKSLRKDPNMAQIYQDIPGLIESGKVELNDFEKILYQKSIEKYKDVFDVKNKNKTSSNSQLDFGFCRFFF